MKLRKLEDYKRSPVDSQFAFIFAFHRRGLALEIADLLCFENHEILRN
jgi:hypothetical protein